MAASQRSLPTAPPPPSPEPRDCAAEELASSESDSSDDEFTLVTPRKRRTTSAAPKKDSKRVNNRKTPPTTTTATGNRYAPLQCSSTQPEELNETDGEDDSTPATLNRQRAPPPIILCGKPTKHTELVNYLAKHATSGFTLKYTANNTNIYIKNNAERAVIVADMAHKKMPFYTYTAATEKTYGYVLRGLDYAPEPAELAGELRLLGVDVRHTYKMRSTSRPLYLVIIGNKKSLAEMNKEHQYLFHTRVNWERHQNKKAITQCHRCQKWGHATSNCHMPPVCLKCAGPHITPECKKPRDTPAKCANCGEAHPANSTNCAIYIKKIEDRAARLEKSRKQSLPPAARRPAYVDAPPPTRNAWAVRANSVQLAQPVARSATAQNIAAEPIIAQTASLAPETSSAPQTSAAPARPITNSDTNDLNILFTEMNKLNTLVNVKNMIAALKDLNAALTSARDDVEKFMTFVNFSQDLKKYNI